MMKKSVGKGRGFLVTLIQHKAMRGTQGRNTRHMQGEKKVSNQKLTHLRHPGMVYSELETGDLTLLF